MEHGLELDNGQRLWGKFRRQKVKRSRSDQTTDRLVDGKDFVMRYQRGMKNKI